MTSVPGAWFDWFGDGFGAHPENDVTQYLRSVTFQRGGTAELTGAAQAGSCTVVLRNDSGMFDPGNASGPLYGMLHDGVRFWFGANEDGTLAYDALKTVRGRFAGRVLDITPIPAAGASEAPDVEVTLEDAIGWYARTPVSLSVAAATADYIPPLPPLPPTGDQFLGGTYYDYVNPGDEEPFSNPLCSVAQAFTGPPNAIHWRPHMPNGVQITLASPAIIRAIRHIQEVPANVGVGVQVYTSPDGSTWTDHGTYAWASITTPAEWNDGLSRGPGVGVQAHEAAISPTLTSRYWQLYFADSDRHIAIEGYY